MADFFEIDFLDVESAKSGDAITIRYEVNGETFIHVVDGGYQATGASVVNHIKQYYGDPLTIDHVVATHPDGDHAGGLRTVLQEFDVGCLWMLRPWLYADELIDRFSKFSNVENLKTRLKEIYPNIAALEEIANERGIPIREPFQGAKIGHFSVMAPTRARYLDLVVESEKTPESKDEGAVATFAEDVIGVLKKAAAFIRSAWGEEIFSPEETSAENEMSVVQYARLNEKRILLTADAGRQSLNEAADFAPHVGLVLPGIDRFQVPHHGSRRNVSTELLDRWLGDRLQQQPAEGEGTFTAVISSAKADTHHPRKSVVRACIHRGANVATTEGKAVQTSHNAPDRGWFPLQPLSYPEEQEE